MLISGAGCLVTNTPTYSDPDPTAPFLTAISPDIRLPIIFNVDTTDFEQIRASVLSEDPKDQVTGVQKPVSYVLYVDYGVTNPGNPAQPFHAASTGGTLRPGHLSDGPREIDLQWFPESFLKPGCHNITLTATHDINIASGCPVKKSDSSMLTWLVVQCDNTTFPCDSLPLAGHDEMTVVDCPTMPDSCKEDYGNANALPDGGVLH